MIVFDLSCLINVVPDRLRRHTLDAYTVLKSVEITSNPLLWDSNKNIGGDFVFMRLRAKMKIAKVTMFVSCVTQQTNLGGVRLT